MRKTFNGTMDFYSTSSWCCFEFSIQQFSVIATLQEINLRDGFIEKCTPHGKALYTNNVRG